MSNCQEHAYGIIIVRTIFLVLDYQLEICKITYQMDRPEITPIHRLINIIHKPNIINTATVKITTKICHTK